MTRRSAFSSALAILALAGCGDDGTDAVREQVDADLRARLEAVDRMIAEGKLPPIATNVRNLNGTLNVDFIDGPNGDNDVVRTRGSRGKKLVWDLDQNGTIDESERTITERETVTQSIVEQGQSSMPQTDRFDVENPYAHSGNASDDGTVEHDDITYDGC